MTAHSTDVVTLSGATIDVDDPDPDAIELEDLAGALAHTCRFAGHVIAFTSVAEHSLLVAAIVADTHGAQAYELQLAAILHDAHKALIGETIPPVAAALGPRLPQMRERLQRAIAQRFDLDHGLFAHPAVLAANERAGSIEGARQAPQTKLADPARPLPIGPIGVPFLGGLAPAQAREQWLTRTTELLGLVRFERKLAS